MSSDPKDLFVAKIIRRLDGLEFHIQSTQFEEAMRLISGGETRVDCDGRVWKGHSFYRLEMGANGIPTAFPGFSAGRFDTWGTKELLFNKSPSINLAPLLAVGLAKGVIIHIPTVISQKQLDLYVAQLQVAVRQFFIDFLKESEKNIRITTEEF